MSNIKRAMMAAAAETDTTTVGLYTWGKNDYGQLGDGTNVSKSSPVQIGELTNWKHIEFCGSGSALATKTDGTLWSWGSATAGILGNGTNTPALSSPVQVGSLTNWTGELRAGGTNSNGSAGAVKSDNTLWTWGYNGYGQLGQGDTSNRSSPTQVGSLSDWAYFSPGRAGFYAIKTNGTLWTCGNNTDSSLGRSGGASSSPVQIGSRTNWASVHGARYMALARQTDNTIWGWGFSGYGMFPAGALDGRQIGSLSTWASLTMCDQTALAIKTDGSLWAWGYNSFGQLGIGNTTNKNYANITQVGSLTNWASVESNGYHTLAKKTDGSLWAWGENTDGQLGDGTTTNRSSPVQIGPKTDWTSVSKDNSQYGGAGISGGIREAS